MCEWEEITVGQSTLHQSVSTRKRNSDHKTFSVGTPQWN